LNIRGCWGANTFYRPLAFVDTHLTVSGQNITNSTTSKVNDQLNDLQIPKKNLRIQWISSFDTDLKFLGQNW
jgi:hypothetical protein